MTKPTPEYRAHIFDAAAADFAELRPDLWGPVAQATLDVSRPARGERVLDACCGDGSSAIPAARAVGPTGSVDAVDLSPGLLANLRERAQGLAHLNVVQADVTRFGEPASYDLVQCVLGIFFFADMDAGARHLVSLVRPGGRAALTIWRRGSIEPVGEALQQAATDAGLDTEEYPDGEPPLISRVNSFEAWGEWVHELGLTDVTVHEAPLSLNLEGGRAWRTVLGSGYRRVVEHLPEEQREDVRTRFLEILRRQDMHTVDATTLIGTGWVA